MRRLLALANCELLIYRREQLWLPAGLWALFALLMAFFAEDWRAIEVAGGFLSIVLPLVGGLLVASTVVDDAALELHLTSPRPPWRLLVERSALVLGIVAASALAFQAYLLVMRVDLGHLGDPLGRQLAWLVPTVALMSLTNVVALAAAQATVGVLLGGVVWLFQLICRDWFATNPWAVYAFLFLGGLGPHDDHLFANRVCLLALAAVFTIAGAQLLRREERYL